MTEAPHILGRPAGSLIGAAFGLVLVVVNAGPLPAAASVPLRVLGVAIFVAVLSAVFSHRRPRDCPPGHPVGRPYRLVVASMVIALIGGRILLDGPLGLPFTVLGATVAACGIAGFAPVATGAGSTPLAVVSGVVPGPVLLAFAWWGARHTDRVAAGR